MHSEEVLFKSLVANDRLNQTSRMGFFLKTIRCHPLTRHRINLRLNIEAFFSVRH